MLSNDLPVIKVSEITRYIKGLLNGDPRLQDLWVAGELSNFKHHRSGHMYFTLKDSSASLRCVYFRRENARCPFKPADGMEVFAHGSISLYEPDGVYQLYVQELEPAGMGSLYLAFEQLKKKLEMEGLFNQQHKKSIPGMPRKIGVVTSPTGAALQDMLATFKKRYPHVEILVVESLVQGAGAADDLVKAMYLLNQRDDIDLIIIARGGGSLEDLWPFNEEIVARAIFKSRLPVISAIGHETDYTIADFTADLRAATPTAAAVAAVPDINEVEKSLKQLQDRATQAVQRIMEKEKQRLDSIVSEKFFALPAKRIKLQGQQLNLLQNNLKREIVRLLQIKGIELNSRIDRLEGYSPLKVMSRGYCYCRDENGNIIRSVKEVKVNQLLKLNFRDGKATCRTEKIEEGITSGEEKN